MDVGALTQSERAIKLADRDLISAAGGIVAVAAHFGVSDSLVGEWNNLNSRKFMSAARRQDLEDATRDVPSHPHFTRAQALRQGYELIPLPSTDVPAGMTIFQALAKSMEEAGELHRALIEFLADGEVTQQEAGKGEALARDAAQANMRLAGLLKQIAEVA